MVIAAIHDTVINILRFPRSPGQHCHNIGYRSLKPRDQQIGKAEQRLIQTFFQHRPADEKVVLAAVDSSVQRFELDMCL